MERIRVSLISLVAIALLAVPAFGQTVTTDCREFLGGIRCESTNNRIQIPDFVGDNLRRDQARQEGFRRAMETRALIDQMRSQIQLNNALTNQLNQPPVAMPQIAAPIIAPAPQPQTVAPQAIDFLEVLDYAKQVVARYKAEELSAEMMKSLVNLKANEWAASLQNRGLRPIQIDQLIALARKELKALQPPETVKKPAN